MPRKVIITCAVTGAETTRKQNPNLPITPEEIAQSAAEACEAGASILHLHVRDKDGNPTQDLDVFKKTIDLVRSKCDMVIEVTTGGAVGMTDDERLQPVTLRPEMASLDCGSVNFAEDYIVNPMPTLRRFATAMRDYGVKPTLECFDLSQITTSKKLIEEGLIDTKYPQLYGMIFGLLGGCDYDPEIINFLVRHLPAGSQWTAFGVSRWSLPTALCALAMGGNLRIGFEDNVYYERGRLAKSNAELVERMTHIIRTQGDDVATAEDVRKMFGLKKP
ncbi:MAG: 3-keto-5-aminohexanoate cleavage protein [bacterium]|nr:3-keto-5-aminohexanoate cleavage protein [bacterium]